MRIDLHEDAVEALRGEWEALFAADPLATPFTSPAWVLACWRHYAEGARPWILAVRVDGRLVGLAPLAMSRRRGVRAAHVLAEPLADYWDVLALPSERGAVLEAVAEELRRRAGEWDEILIGRLPARSGTPAALERAGLAPRRGHALESPGLELPGTFDEYLGTLPPQRRSNLRRHLRRLDTGEVELRPVLESTELSAAVDRWHALRLSQWTEQRRRLLPLQACDVFPRFIADVLFDLVPVGRALLWEFTAGGRVVGSYVNFVDDDAFYWYLGGYDPGAAALGVGKIAIGEGIRSSIHAGRRYYDFMLGAEPYKYWYGATDRGVDELRLRSRHPRSMIAMGLRRVRARVA